MIVKDSNSNINSIKFITICPYFSFYVSIILKFFQAFNLSPNGVIFF